MIHMSENIHVVYVVKNARFLDERPLMFLLLQHFLVLLTTETINYVYMCKIKCSCSTTPFYVFRSSLTKSLSVFTCFLHLYPTAEMYNIELKSQQFWGKYVICQQYFCCLHHNDEYNQNFLHYLFYVSTIRCSKQYFSNT